MFDDLRAIEREMETLTQQDGRTRSAQPGVRAVADRFHHARFRVPRARRLRHRGAGGHGARRARVSARKTGRAARRSSRAAGRCASRSPSCCSKSRTCCCSTSRRTTSIWRHATGSKITCSSYPYAFVLISHDRYFLDVTVNRIAEIWNKAGHVLSRGNYEKYLPQKDERLTQLQAAYRNQRDRIEQLEAFINRFRSQATKAKQVQSRIKELEKIERIEIPPEEKTIHFKFPQPKPSGRIVAEFTNVSKSYGEKYVFGGANFIIERGDRVALVGVNGAGKSTLIKLLAGAEPLTRGRIPAGAQRASRIISRRTSTRNSIPRRACWTIIGTVAPRSDKTELRSLLGCFLFSGTTCSRRSACSRAASATGTRWRGCCCTPRISCCWTSRRTTWICARRTCCWTRSQEFTGTVVFVSHDRYFIDRLATRVFEIGDGQVRIYPGNYEDYLWRKEAEAAGLDHPLQGLSSNGSGAAPEPVEPAAPKKRLNPMKRKQLQDRACELESRISELEAEIAGHELALSEFRGADDAVRTAALLEQRREELNERVAEWEKVSEEIEAAV